MDSIFVWLNDLKFVEPRELELFIENIRFVTHFALHVAACWTAAAWGSRTTRHLPPRPCRPFMSGNIP
jgi:hypothetical protein